MGFFDFFRSHDTHKMSKHEQEKAHDALIHATRNLDIDVSISAHENWKLRLEAFLEGKSNEDLCPEHVACDQKCELGQWIYGEGGHALEEYVTFADLRATHKMFHHTASNVIMLHQSGHKEKAEQILHGDFEKLSRKIEQRLTDLKGL